MPPRSVVPPSAPPTTFPYFPLLPTEIRLHIYSFTISIAFVPIYWCPRTRTFKSTRKPPSLLQVSHEARAFGLKHYQLSFASSPEFARVYFNYENDLLSIDWGTLGSQPGRIGRKIAVEEVERVQGLLIHEADLLDHSEEDMRELSKFTGVKHIAVICDKSNPAQGSEYGAEEMDMFSSTIEGEGEEKWPALVCLRDRVLHDDDDDEEMDICSRHWWFEGWNFRASNGQKEKWSKAMSTCLQLTSEGDEEDDFFWELGRLLPPMVMVFSTP